MMHKLVALSLGVVALAVAPAPLRAEGASVPDIPAVAEATEQLFPAQSRRQIACSERDIVVGQLAEHYGETRRGIGLAANNTVMEIYASDSGSWTITITLASGQTCLVASGEAYEELEDALPAMGKGT